MQADPHGAIPCAISRLARGNGLARALAFTDIVRPS